MTRRIIQQTSFTNGELSPLLHGRVGTNEYLSGLESARNCKVLSHGPVERRQGSQFIAETKDSSVASRLVKYQLSKEVGFILEFGNQYIRFYNNNGQVVESALTITGISQANPAVVTSAAHGLSNGDHVYITGVSGMTEINNVSIPYKVANVATDTFEVQTLAGTDVDSTGYTAYTSGGSIQKIYEITSPYTTSQLDDIQYVQSSTDLYIVHPDVSPRKLVRTSNTAWELSEIGFLPPPTYEKGNYPSTTLTPGATTGLDITFTAGAGTFLAGDIGRQLINHAGTGRAAITSVTSTTEVVCDIIEDFPSTSAIASGDWQIDLSPVVSLNFSGFTAGAIVDVRPEYVSGSLGSRIAISGITNANPGVVTTSAAHGLADGDQVVINDVVGMTQLNGRVFTIDVASTTTFNLVGENTTGYTTYASGGIARQDFTGVGKDAFSSGDVGKYILANGGVLQIIEYTGSRQVKAEIIKSMNTIDDTANWTMEEPTWAADRGYPKAVGLFGQRLIFADTATQPKTIWLSEVGLFDSFGVGPDDDDSIEITIDAKDAGEITWLAGVRSLIVGTNASEATLSSVGATYTPSDIGYSSRTTYGSQAQQVAVVGEEILFKQGSGRKLRTFRYDFNIDGYTGEDLTFLAEHITAGGIKEFVYVQDPDTVIYCVLNNGDMIVGTYDRTKRVIAWTTYDTDGDYESIQSISKDEEDQVWVIVERTINGSTKRYVELFTHTDVEDDLASFSDSYLTYSVPLTITNITQANPAVVTSNSHGLSNGDTVRIKGIKDPYDNELDTSKTNMSDLNEGIYTVASVTANTFALSNTNTSTYNAYGSSGFVYKTVSTVSGLDHLEGETVQVKIDGATHPDETVTNGSITLDRTAGEVVVGLKYTTKIKTLNLNFDMGIGSMQSQSTRIIRSAVGLHNSVRPIVNGEFIPSRNTGDALGKKVPLFTGLLEYSQGGWDKSASVTIQTSEPFPLRLTGIFNLIDSDII